MNINIEELKQYYKEKNFSKNTIKAYIQNLKTFFIFLDFTNLEFKDLSTALIREYQEFLIEQSYELSTANNKLTALSQYIKFLRNWKDLELPRIKIEKIDVKNKNYFEEIIELEDYRKIIKRTEIEKTTNHNPNALRAKALFSAAYLTGARAMELRQLKVTDINFDTVTVITKGRKGKIVSRELFLNKKLKRILRTYINKERIPKTDFLFTGRQGQLSYDMILQIFSKYAKMCNVNPKYFQPHKLRHLFALEFLERNNGDLMTLKSLLGHEHLKTTELYLKQKKENVKKQMQNIR